MFLMSIWAFIQRLALVHTAPSAVLISSQLMSSSAISVTHFGVVYAWTNTEQCKLSLGLTTLITRLQRWYVTIPSLDQWWKTIANHRNQWLRDPKTIEKPLNPMVVPNHSIQWWWCLWKPLKLCNGSKNWSSKSKKFWFWDTLQFFRSFLWLKPSNS